VALGPGAADVLHAATTAAQVSTAINALIRTSTGTTSAAYYPALGQGGRIVRSEWGGLVVTLVLQAVDVRGPARWRWSPRAGGSAVALAEILRAAAGAMPT
jgi:hypothetical protein